MAKHIPRTLFRMVDTVGSSNTETISGSAPTSNSIGDVSNGGGSTKTLNIYSPNSLKRSPVLTVQSEAATPFNGNMNNYLYSHTARPSVRDCVNLVATKEYHIDELQNCRDIKDIKGRDKDNSAHGDNNTVLIFDLTTSGCLLSSSGPSESTKINDPGADNDDTSSKDIYRVHLSLPSTLVKRPKYHFEKLLQSVIDDSKRLKLMSLIDNCNNFLFYDGSSNITCCSLSTYWLIKKFNDFLHDKLCKRDVKLYILERMDKEFGAGLDGNRLTRDMNDTTSLTSATTNNSAKENSSQRKLNLKIKILPKSADKMFIQSIKKDSVHYSPNSLKKFFKFHIPEELEDDDPVLPNWLKPFSRRNENDAILQKLLKNFEFLENLELKRLEKGLTSDKRDQESSRLQDSNSYHKIYSLSNLQKEFRKQKKLTMTKPNCKKTTTSSPRVPGTNLKLSIPKQQSSSIINSNLLATAETSNNSPSPSSSTSSSHLDTDSDSLLTPMDNYAMSQGIQSFTKNRYSNILPYEHSRVKLQPSPIHGPSNSSMASYSPPVGGKAGNGQVRTPSDTSYSKKRRNSNSSSYFTQRFSDSSSQRDKTSQETLGSLSMENFNDYFNANYLNLPQVNSDFNYIATQAPLPSTIDDFWKVISANNVKVIISLNSNDELFLRKWDIYWNNDRSGQKYKIDITETFENCCHVDGCVLRIFSFYKNGDEENESKKLTVYQLQYTKWLDSCGIVMKDILSIYTIKNMLLNKASVILSDLRTGQERDAMAYSGHIWPETFNKTKSLIQQPPLLVHCSAGCGRTGVFITLDFLLNVLTKPTNESNNIDVWNMSQDLIFITINELRKQRISMVQNLTQYITCYESMLQYFALQKQNKAAETELPGTR